MKRSPLFVLAGATLAAVLAGSACRRHAPDVLPRTGDVSRRDADALFPAPDGRRLVYFTPAGDAVLYDLALKKRVAVGQGLERGIYRAWTTDGTRFLVAEEGPNSTQKGLPSLYVPAIQASVADVVAPLARNRLTSFDWDPAGFSVWLSTEMARLHLSPPAADAGDPERALQGAAALLLSTPDLYERFSPEQSNLSGPAAEHLSALRSAGAERPTDVFSANAGLVAAVYPKHEADRLLLIADPRVAALLARVRAALGRSRLSEGDFALTPDGGAVFVRSSADGASFSVERLSAAGGAPVPWATSSAQTDGRRMTVKRLWLSPDGRSLLFAAENEGARRSTDLYLLSAGADAKPISRKIADAIGASAAWSADGRRFFFVRKGQGVAAQAAPADAASSGAR